MSIFDMFRSSPPSATPAPDNIAANTTVPSAATTVPDGSGPAAIPAAGEGEKSPLANYEKLWQADDNKTKAPASLVPNMAADPAKVMAAAGTIDFTSNLPPELLDKAKQGDSAALVSIINHTAQSAYGQAALSTAKIVEAALKKQEDAFHSQVMPEILRRHAISEGASNPVFSNPAVAPLVKSVTDQLARKYPDASPAEINRRTEEYLTEFASAIAPNATSGKAGGKPQVTPPSDTDWSAYFIS